ncbi:MAG: acyl-CoA dehydrogenase family protein [Archangiaceae bacterium]|nr:acyl-CoA dehydrogenase family protein [Archangiaceae bacterium]
MPPTDEKFTPFMTALCFGRIEEDLILPYPKTEPKDVELLKNVLASVDQLLKPHEKDFRAWDRAGELPSSFIEELRQFGLFSLIIPEQFGGMGMNATAYSRTLQQISRHDGSVAVTVGAHSSIGLRGLLLFGTDEQKKQYFEKLATGEMIAAFCLTEPGSGSDAASIKTTAVREGDHWVLNGNKLWITNGGIAQFFTVFAKTGSATERGNMTAFIVTRDMPGVSVGPHEDKMGLRASSTTTVHFDNVKVPAGNVLGEVGKGFKVAMNILNSGRGGIGGGAVGGMKAAIERSTRQAKDRVQFGKPIAEFGLIKQKIGHMVVDCYATESAVNMVNHFIDTGIKDYAVEGAITKVFGSEALWRTCDEALQIAGGNGFMCEFPYERVLRDARINRIFEGTNDILRLFIALTAMNEVGASLKELASSLKGIFDSPIKGFGVLSDYARRRAALATGIPAVAEKTAFTKLPSVLKPKAELFEDLTRKLASAVDRILRKHGKDIIGKQFASKRLADAMIDLFVFACTLSRVATAMEAQGATKVTKEMEILEVLSGQVRRRVTGNFSKIDDNDDELIKSLADHALDAERYSWDNV